MSKRKPLEPIVKEQNENIQFTNQPIKQRNRSKSSGASLAKQNIIDPQAFLNEEEYCNYWNQYENSKNLQNALDQTNSMNLKMEEELNNLSNIEDELRDQITLNQELYDTYVQYRDQQT